MQSEKRVDLIYPELSYEIVGALFDVFNQLGGGCREKYYQKAIAIALENKKIKFQEQVYIPIEFQGKCVGKYYLDFLIEDKIILEIKSADIFLKSNIGQIYGYLKKLNLKLGILANFIHQDVKFKRILNIT